MRITKTSPITGKQTTLEVPCTEQQLVEWQTTNRKIQDIMPEVPLELREFIMTGITPKEWETIFGKD